MRAALLLAIFLGACSSQPSALRVYEAEDIAIWRLVLCEEGEHRPEGLAVVSKSTGAPKRERGFLQGWAHSDELEAGLRARTRKDIELPDAVGCPGLVLASDSEIEHAFSKYDDLEPRPWSGFYEAFPDAKQLIGVGAPGYSKDGKHAVVFFTRATGVLGGYGIFLRLQKTGEGWRIVDQKLDWIS